MTKRLYVTGGWGYGNKGDNAILMGMLETFRRDFKDVALHMTSFEPTELKRMHGLNAQVSIHKLLTWKNPLSYFRRLALMIWSATGVMLSPALNRHLREMAASDAVVMGGGGYFNDAWKDALPSRIWEIRFAKAAGTPLIIYGQTVGPFSEENCANLLKTSLDSVAYIAYRDVQSAKTLRLADYSESTMGLTADEANLIPKIATPADRAKFCPNGKSKLVGVMIQHLRRHESPTGASPRGQITDNTRYYDEVCGALARIAKDGDVSFVIIPSTTWDQSSCDKVAEGLAAKGIKDVHLLNDPDIDTFVRACQSVDVMISTNMHPVIIAATAGIPSIALSYHYKLDDFMASIGTAANVARIDNFSADWIVTQFGQVVDKMDALQQSIRKDHEGVKEMARRNGAALRQLIYR
ncbi:polysaccharide pyruvyl transferase family protein [Chitinimonas arctica]|nr:polysaccharide pyruvyl transferase family protein [Chitinimonas arctica]